MEEVFNYLDKSKYIEGLNLLDKLYEKNERIFQIYNIDGKYKMLVKYFNNKSKANLLLRYEIDDVSLLIKENQKFFSKMDKKIFYNYLENVKCDYKLTLCCMLFGWKTLNIYKTNLNRINFNLKYNGYYLINYTTCSHGYYPKDLILSQLEETNYKFLHINDNNYIISQLFLKYQLKELLPKLYPNILNIQIDVFELFLSKVDKNDFKNFINNNDLNISLISYFNRIVILKDYFNKDKLLSIVKFIFTKTPALKVKFLSNFNENILNQTIDNVLIKDLLSQQNINNLQFTNQIII